MQHVWRDLEKATAAVQRCQGSISDAERQLHSSLGSAITFGMVRGAHGTRQQERLAAALMSLLRALADERHPGDDAWQTATLAALVVLNSGKVDKAVEEHLFVTPAGRDALQALVQRLHDCHKGKGPPLSVHGVCAVAEVARVVFAAWRDPGGSVEAPMAEGPPLTPALLLLMELVVQLFAPPGAPSQQRTAAACTCPGRAPGAAAASGLRAGDVMGTALELFGRSLHYAGPTRGDICVGFVARLGRSVVPSRLGVDASGPATWWAQFRSLHLMLLAQEVHAARSSGRPRAFSGAGAAEPARFLHPAFLVQRRLPPPASPASASDTHSACQTIYATAAALEPQHAPPCAACLPDQLMLVLEAAALVDDPQQAAQCYINQNFAWDELRGRGGDVAAPLRDFWRRAGPRVLARALEAARALPQGSEACSAHVALLESLVPALYHSFGDGCQQGDITALDAICEAAARTSQLIPACKVFFLRLRCIEAASSSGQQPRAASLATFAGAAVSMGKMSQACTVLGAASSDDSKFWVGAMQAQPSRCPLHADGLWALARGGGGSGGLGAGAVQDGGDVAGAAAAASAGGQDHDAIGHDASATEGGSPPPLEQLVVLIGACVKGAAAQGWLLAGGEAALTDIQRDLVTSAASQLQQPLLWDTVQRATHGRIAPLDTGGGVSACTAALRLLADLHDWLDPRALGVRLPGCYNPRCTNMSGASEAELRVRICSACHVARYCSAACSKQHWRWHKVACRLAAAATGGAHQP